MSRKDRRIVALILALALVGGLLLVEAALDRARLRQKEAMDAAREALVTGDIDGTGGTIPVPTLPQITDPTEPPGETAPPAASGPDGEGQKDPEVRPPQMGEETVTIDTLSQWLQTESLEAQGAEAALQQAKAQAAGIGTADDALRRTFAGTQGEDNYQAALNQLDRLAAQLGQQYLLCKWNLEWKEAALEYYQKLAAKIETRQGSLQGATDIGLTAEAQVRADLEQVQGLYDQAKLEVEEARLALEAAGQAINLTVGNPVTDPITVTDELTPTPLPKDTVTKALTAALENRNELKGAQYQLLREEEALTRLRYQFAPNAPEILEQQQRVLDAQMAIPALENEIEGALRTLYSSMTLLSERLLQDEDLVEQYRKTQPAPDYQLGADGGSNLAELLNQWNQCVSTMSRYGADCAQLAMDVRDANYAVGVGLVTAEI